VWLCGCVANFPNRPTKLNCPATRNTHYYSCLVPSYPVDLSGRREPSNGTSFSNPYISRSFPLSFFPRQPNTHPPQFRNHHIQHRLDLPRLSSVTKKQNIIVDPLEYKNTLTSRHHRSFLERKKKNPNPNSSNLFRYTRKTVRHTLGPDHNSHHGRIGNRTKQ